MAVSNVIPLHRGGVGGQSTASNRADARVTTPPPAFASDASGPSDEIVAGFCAGDLDALGAVFDHFSKAVWSVAMRVLGDRQLAEDATQETFLRAWKAASRFDRRRPMAPWLLTIARRTALDVHRREFRPTRGAHAEEQDAPLHLPGIERAWEVWEVKLALDQLPEDERRVMHLAHFEGMSHPQIATSLGVPVGTVKSRSFRAHKRLASLLSHMIDPQGDRP